MPHSLGGQDGSARGHLERRLAVSAQGQRGPEAARRIVGRVVGAVPLKRGRSHPPRLVDNSRDAGAQLDLDGGNVERVAKALAQLAGPKVAPAEVPGEYG